jgi:two-component system heavy metal sensor histidine kinase CusS
VKTLSLTARISLLFAVAATVVLLVTGYFLARAVEGHFVEGDRHELEGKLELIRHLLQRVDGPAALDRLPQQLDDALVGHQGLAVAVVDAQGLIWFATSGAGFPHALLRHQDCSVAAPEVKCLPGGLRQWRQGERNYRGMAVPMRAGNGEPHTVVVALDIQHHDLFMDQFRLTLIMAMTLAALATASLGWVATRRGLAPLRRVIDLASGISAERLATRLPETGLPDELQALAAAFNAMLARLDDSFRRLSEFSSDIAHELRTPVSNLMTQTQVALSSARGNEEYREVLYSSLEEYERMAQMIGDMLYLAQAENGLLKPGLGQVDLAVEAQGLLEFFEAWAEERGVSLALSGAASVSGDRLMLRRGLSNLIANAVRHTPPGETVDVLLETRGNEATVRVVNPGAEIPAEHLPRLFDRFYRVDPARQRKGEGAGLGLAIVKSIVAAHGGAIVATSMGGKTEFRITLPVA